MLIVMIANTIYATAALVCNYELNLKTSNYRLSHDSPHPPFPSWNNFCEQNINPWLHAWWT